MSDERKRRNLQDLYKKTATFLDKLDTKVKTALQERFGDFKATLEENMTNLLPRNQYPVLVAGKILISYSTKNTLMSKTATSSLQVTGETKNRTMRSPHPSIPEPHITARMDLKVSTRSGDWLRHQKETLTQIPSVAPAFEPSSSSGLHMIFIYSFLQSLFIISSLSSPFHCFMTGYPND